MFEGTRSSRRRVLLVHEHDRRPTEYAAAFDVYGFDVHDADRDSMTADHVRAIRPDLVVVDIAGPAQESVAAIRQLRQHEEMAHVPVLAIAPEEDAEDVEDRYPAEFDQVVAKSVDPVQLIWAARLLVRLSGNDF